MQKKHLYFVLLILLLPVSCSGEEPANGTDNPDTNLVWDKSRTAKITILSDLTGNIPFTTATYTKISDFAKSNNSYLLIFDKANVKHTDPRVNPAAQISAKAGMVPLFVTTSVSESQYTGSAMLFKKSVSQMELTPVNDECRLIQQAVEIRAGLNANVMLASFDKLEQISAATPMLKKAIEQSALVVGTIPRDRLGNLGTALSSQLVPSDYELTLLANQNNKSQYVVYALMPKKWKFRRLTEINVENTIKSFLIEAEYLK